MRTLHRCRGPLGVAALLLAAPAARAELRETAIVPGEQCQPSGQSTDDYFYSQGIKNRSQTKNLSVVCPVPVNIPSNNNVQYALLGASGSTCATDTSYRPYVDVWDQSSWADVACTLYILSPNGSVQNSFSASTSGNSQFFYKRLFFNAEGTALAIGRSLVVTCLLPPNDMSFTGYNGVAAIAVPMCQVTQ
jgi:hypothetical protein